ncbi:DapH/DapD/GlmU-related protein [Moritella sp. 28]|uniref:DapH/DapD/GlmU-related protein n=1 Tax=Moritella sp. 28 TaxID=2746232 RepID=UPI001BAA6833|nr:DapH/DapD/GlmU-related protein [Moritella sp. 28]QUM83587.1 acyltransferase [Moritella sp. 28]
MKIVKIFWAIRALAYRAIFNRIGNLCYIGPPLYIENSKNTTLGSKVRIFPGLRLESHYSGKIIIEDDVAIGQNFHITSAEGIVEIASKTTISGNVFITNIDHNYTDIDEHIMNQKFIIKDTFIGENCFIGYGVAIQAGTKLGRQCIVGANSVVRGHFPDRCVIVGAPAKIIKLYNEETGNWERV